MKPIKRTGYYRFGQPKVGQKISSCGTGGRTTIAVAKQIGNITPGGVSVVEIRVLDRIRAAMNPLRSAGDFDVKSVHDARDFMQALREGVLEAEENDVLSDVVVTRAEQIQAMTKCSDTVAVRQSIRELLDPSFDG